MGNDQARGRQTKTLIDQFLHDTGIRTDEMGWAMDGINGWKEMVKQTKVFGLCRLERAYVNG